MKESEEGKPMERYPVFIGWEEVILGKCPHNPNNLEIQCNPNHNSTDIFHRKKKKKNYPKICLEPQSNPKR